MNETSKRIAGAAALSITAVAAAMGIALAVDQKESAKGSFKGNEEELKGSYQGAFFKGPTKGKVKFSATETDFGKGSGVFVQTKDDEDGEEDLFFAGATLESLSSGFNSMTSVGATFVVSLDSSDDAEITITITIGPDGSDATITAIV